MRFISRELGVSVKKMHLHRTNELGLPTKLVVMGIGSLFISVLLVYGWKLDYKAESELYSLSGVIENIWVSDVFRGGKNINISVNNNGTSHHLSQIDITRSFPKLKALKKGDHIQALLSHDDVGRNLEWFWEIKKGDSTIITYEETISHFEAIGNRNKPISYFLFIASLLLILSGVILRIKNGSWKS